MIVLAILIVYSSLVSTKTESFAQQSSNQDYSVITKYDPKVFLSIHDSKSIQANSQKWNDISNHQDKTFFQEHKYSDIIDRDFTFSSTPTFQDIKSGAYTLTGINLLNTSISGSQCDDLSIDFFNQFSISASVALQSFTNTNYNFLEIYGNTQNGLLIGLGFQGQQVTITLGNNKPLTFDKSQLKVGVFQVLSFLFDATKNTVQLYVNDTPVSTLTFDITKMSIDQDLLNNKSIDVFSNRLIEVNPSKKLNLLLDTFILFNKFIDPSLIFQFIEKQQIQFSISSDKVTETTTQTTTTTVDQGVCPFNQTDSSLLPCKSKACVGVNWSKNGFLIDNTMPVECVKKIYDYCSDPAISDPACKCLKVENINSSQCKNQRDLYTYIVNYDKIANQTRPINFTGNKILQNQCDKNPLDRLCSGLKNQVSTTSSTKTPITAPTTSTKTPTTTSTTTNTKTTPATTTATPTTTPATTTAPTTTVATAASNTKKNKCVDVQSNDSRLINLQNTQKFNSYLSS